MIEIEKNIPVVEHGNSKHPFSMMEVGDSFKVPDGKERTFRSAASMVAARKGMKFAIRKYEGGYRCWRVA